MKQSGRIWNKTLNDQLIQWGFARLGCEPCIYFCKTATGTTIVAVHVDDFLLISSLTDENDRFKGQLRSTWAISDLSTARFVVGIAVQWNRMQKTVYLSQTALIDKIIQSFGQKDAAPVSIPMEPGLRLQRVSHASLPSTERDTLTKLPYRSLVGCLLYLTIGTRPDISFAVQQLSQFLDCYSHLHWHAATRIVRYLKGTRHLRLCLG